MNSKLIIQIIIFLMALAIVISVNIIKKLIMKPKDDEYSGSRRMSQLRNFSHENVVKSRLDEYVSKSMKYDKRQKLNKLLLQSGLGLRIADMYILSVISGLGLSIAVGALLNNVLVGFAMLFIGIALPGQIIRFIRNRRIMKLDNQIASFVRMTVKRYYVTGKLSSSIEMTLSDFSGQEPITSEIKKTISDIEVGSSALDALDSMYERTYNEYLRLFTTNLRAASNIGTEEMKQKLLDGVIDKFDEDIKLGSKLKKEINSPVMEGFLMMLIVPATFIMQASFDETYLPFMRNEPIGKIALAGAVILVFISGWLLINKVGAPLDKDED